MIMKKLLSMFFLCIMIMPVRTYPQGNDSNKIKQYFKMDIHQLLTLVITTAGKKREKIAEIPASVVVVSREEIETYGYQTLKEILENIPGLYLIDDYMHPNIGVRGFWNHTPNRNVIILVNNIPYRDELVSAYYLENIPIPVEAIDRIEVVRGPMSVIYGNGAFFGVINIITNQYKDESFNGMVTASLGSEKTKKLFARGSGKSGDFKFVFNGSYFDTYGIDKPLNKMVSNPAILPNFGLTEDHSTGGQLERSEKFFNFSGSFKGLSIDFSLAENRKELMGLLPSVSDGTLVIFRDMRINIGYKKEWSDTFRLESKLLYFINNHSWKYDWLFDGSYGTNDNGSSGFKVAANLFITPSPQLDITVGVDYLLVNEVFNDFTVPFLGLNLVHYNLVDGESMITGSIFTQIQYTLSDHFKIIAGAMLEQTPEYTLEKRTGDFTVGNITSTPGTFRHTRVEFIPRLALLYSFNDHNIFKFLYGKAINRPSFHQNRDLINPLIPSLKPETIHTLELNYIAQLSSKLTLNLSFFRNMLDNLIFRTAFTVGGDYSSYYANVGTMTTHGAEMTIMCSPSHSLYFELSTTYQDTKDKRPGFEDMEVGYSPKFLGYLKASYFFNKNISLALNGAFIGPMETYHDDTLTPPRRLGERADGYFTLDTNLRIQKLFGTGMFLNLRVSNLLDEESHYPATANNFQFADKGTIGRGRSFLLTLGWKF